MKFIPKDFVNLILSFYFSGIGLFSLFELFYPLIQFLLPNQWSDEEKGYKFSIKIPYLNNENSFKITYVDILCFIMVSPLVILYFQTKYWMLNNLIGTCVCKV